MTPVPSSAGTGRKSARNQALLAVTILAIFALHLAFVLHVERSDLVDDAAGDARPYRERAGEILGGDWIGSAVFFEAPLFPYFLALGAATLVRGNFLLLAPVYLIFLGRRSRKSAARLLVGLLLPVLAVTARNAAIGHDFVPLTYHAGPTFYHGNHPGARGTYAPIVPGRQNPPYEQEDAVRIAEDAEGRALRPSEVSRYWFGRAFAFIAGDPAGFARLTLRRAALFWRAEEIPDTYDFRTYRRFFPELSVAAVSFGLLAPTAARTLLFAGGLAASRSWARLGGLAAAALVLMTMVNAGGRTTSDATGDYNLGIIEELGGRPEAAVPLYREALGTGGDHAEAAANLGRILAASNDPGEAVPLLERAAALLPGEPIPRLYLALALARAGDIGGAEAALERAEEVGADVRARLLRARLCAARGDAAAARGALDAARAEGLPDDDAIRLFLGENPLANGPVR